MDPSHDTGRQFPVCLDLQKRRMALRPLTASDREQLLGFARSLAHDDLLFMQRDITEPAELDKWIDDDLEGRQRTLVACEGPTVVGYATCERGRARWMRHVAELRVVVTKAARSIGLGRLLLQLAFEMAVEEGATKVIARMTPDQAGAVAMFTHLGFEEEAILHHHALGADGHPRDLLVLSVYPGRNKGQQCERCGVPALNALSINGARLCSECFEELYQELGRG